MLTLSLPDIGKFVYPRSRFAGMDNLQRVTEINRKDFRDYVDRTPFNLENQHRLVGLLQMLSIDPDWELDYVVKYTRFRANSLCTTFKITSINHIGETTVDGFYRENVQEHWVLIDNTKTYAYNDDLRVEKLKPVIPLFSTVLERGYKHTVEKPVIKGQFKDCAIIGIDLVELALGWWLYMNQDRMTNTGIHAYVCQYPLVTATLIHNQLTVTNILYEFFVKEEPLKILLSTNNVVFNTLGEEKLLKEYLVFLIDALTDRRLIDVGNLITQIGSVYREPFFNYVDPGQNNVFSQTVWAWEPQVLKLYAIYLAIGNRMGYKASDINVPINRCIDTMINRYRSVPGNSFRQVLIDLAKEVKELNIVNFN
jgi:hypothetical protein